MFFSKSLFWVSERDLPSVELKHLEQLSPSLPVNPVKFLESVKLLYVTFSMSAWWQISPPWSQRCLLLSAVFSSTEVQTGRWWKPTLGAQCLQSWIIKHVWIDEHLLQWISDSGLEKVSVLRVETIWMKCWSESKYPVDLMTFHWSLMMNLNSVLNQQLWAGLSWGFMFYCSRVWRGKPC